jgi:hypothetical protein
MSSTDELVSELKSAFQLTGKCEFRPDSTWFSYGSNLNRVYFETKMQKRGSDLTLINPKKAVLNDFGRLLDNESSGHGLGYEIHYKAGESVEGVVHTIPDQELGKFLRMEGIVAADGHVSKSPTYKIVQATVHSNGKAIEALALEGNKRRNEERRKVLARSKLRELREYIEASIAGAAAQGCNARQFESDLQWLASL